jgi:transcriptional regulator with XRE-family HTH domain
MDELAVSEVVLPSLLRRYRLRSGRTQKQLAEAAGVSQNYIALLETGQRQRPSLELLLKLSQLLGLSEAERSSILQASGQTVMTDERDLAAMMQGLAVGWLAAATGSSNRGEQPELGAYFHKRSRKQDVGENPENGAPPMDELRLIRAVQALVALLASREAPIEKRISLAEELGHYGRWRLSQSTARTTSPRAYGNG